MTRKSIIINYTYIKKPYKTLKQRYQTKRQWEKTAKRWKPIAIIALMALLIGIAGILVNLPEKQVAGEEIEPIETNILYGSISLETQITPKETILPPKVHKTTPKTKTLARGGENTVIKTPQSDIIKQVQSIAEQYGWGTGEQWEALSWIIFKESSWNNNAQNKTSTAYGLFQFLDKTWSGYKCTKTSDIEIQVKCGIKYIQARYKTPTGAKAHHIINNWY